MKYILGTILTIFCATASFDAFAGPEHNHVHIDQIGDDLVLNIDQQGKNQHIDLDLGLQYGNVDNLTMWIGQLGEDNEVEFSVSGDGNSVKITQVGQNNFAGFTSTWGKVNCPNATFCGDVDGLDNEIEISQKCTEDNNCQYSEASFHFWGDNNLMRWGQGVGLNNINDTNFDTWDGEEHGGHKAVLDYHGDNNVIAGYQTNGNTNTPGYHTANIWIYADNNDVWWKQINDGNKTVNFKSYQNGSQISGVQKGNGAHNATINLYGSQPTTLNLTQNSSTAQTYNLTQTCQTSGGCTINITQN
jgi:hypothetical protein|tara:strand:+ start:1703 stop:2608 length:906 start_codon:yes stop_codon:yes gene_type:complete